MQRDPAATAAVHQHDDTREEPLTLGAVTGSLLDLRALRSGYGLRPLALLFLLGMLATLDAEGFGVLAPLIKHDLGLNFMKFFTITGAVSTAALLLAGPLGYLADRARRTVLVGAGGVLMGTATLLTALAATPLTMGMARALQGAAADLGRIPQFSLLVDYYPVDQRVRMLTLLSVGGSAGAIVSLPLIGFLASTYGWRVPFYAAAGPIALVALWVMLRLPEPVRGYQERRALGVSDEQARREEPRPTQAEAWRLIWSSRVLRYMLYSTAVLTFGSTFSNLRSFYFFQIWRQTPSQLAAIGTANRVADLVALVVGGALIDHIARMRPHRVLQLTAAVSLVSALSGAVFVLAPVLWLSIGTGVVFGAAGTLVAVASTGLLLNVMPPRARGSSVGMMSYWTVPGLLLAPIVGSMADSYGLKPTVLIGTCFPVIAALIQFASARYYESDVRGAELSAAATLTHERSRREGAAKMLVARQLDVRHGAVQALFGVDLDVVEGELIAILGTNGAGKSTLLRTIAGLCEPTGGAVVIDGVDVTHLPPNEIATRGVVYVQGGRSLFPGLTVRENLWLGTWTRGDRAGRHTDFERALGHLPGLRDRLDQRAETLSSGEQHMLALISALLTRPRLLMIDELSMGLAPAIAARLLDIVRAVNAQGTTVMVVEQSMTVALALARRAVFMEHGAVRFDGPAEELRDRPDLLRAVFLRGAASIEATGTAGVASCPVGPRPAAPRSQEVGLLEVGGVSKRYGGRHALRDVTLSLRDGAILGVIGPNGAGKTTLLDIISGYAVPDFGTVMVAGEEVTDWPPHRRARAGIVRRFRSARLFPTLTVDEIVTMCAQQSSTQPQSGPGTSFWRPAPTRSLRERVEALLELLRLGRHRDMHAANLSTGTRRLVDLAAAIAAGPRLLLLDEPAAGLTQAEVEELLPLLSQVRSRLGCAMIVVEHDLALVSGLADDLVCLHLGEVIARGRPDEVLRHEAVIGAYLGQTGTQVAASGGQSWTETAVHS